jgi:hypothetical protein
LRQDVIVHLLYFLVQSLQRFLGVCALTHRDPRGDNILVVDDFSVLAVDRSGKPAEPDLLALRDLGDIFYPKRGSRLGEEHRVLDVLNGPDQSDLMPGDNRCRLYHSSFGEYLLDRNRDYPLDPLTWHRKIACHYLGSREQDWNTIDDYGLNHLAAHLSCAGMRENLLALIDEAWMRVRTKNRESRSSYAGFLADVDLAWRSILENSPQDAASLVRLHASRHIVREQLANILDIDLQALVWTDRVDEALEHARLRQDLSDRANGLLAIVLVSSNS